MTVIASEIARRLKIGLANPGAKIYRVLREGGMLTPEINWADLWHTAATLSVVFSGHRRTLEIVVVDIVEYCRADIAVAAGVGERSRAIMELEREAARIVAEDAEKRQNGGASGRIVISDGLLTVFVKDAHTTVRVAGGAVAITTNE